MIPKIKFIFLTLLTFLLGFGVFFTVQIYAQATQTISYNLLVPLPQPGGNVITAVSGPAFHILALYNFAITISGILAFTIIVIAGFIWVTSAGSPEKINRAKEMVFNAILGLLLLIGSFVLLKTIDPDLGFLVEPTIDDIEISTTLSGSGNVIDNCGRIKRCQDYVTFCGDVYGRPPFCIGFFGLNFMCFGNNCSKEEVINACEKNPCHNKGVATDCIWEGYACWQK